MGLTREKEKMFAQPAFEKIREWQEQKGGKTFTHQLIRCEGKERELVYESDGRVSRKVADNEVTELQKNGGELNFVITDHNGVSHRKVLRAGGVFVEEL